MKSTELEKFIQNRKGCTRWGCTTCGGQIAFRSRLDDFARQKGSVASALIDLDPHSPLTEKRHDSSMEIVLNNLTGGERESVLRQWEGKQARDEAFAEALTRWMPPSDLPPTCQRTVVRTLRSLAVQDRRLRQRLRAYLPDVVDEDAEFVRAFAQDDLADEQKGAAAAETEAEKELEEDLRRREDRLRRAKRRQELADIGSLPAGERLEALADLPGLRAYELERSWAAVDFSVIRGLSLSRTERLIEVLEGAHGRDWTCLRRLLLRHQFEITKRE